MDVGPAHVAVVEARVAVVTLLLAWSPGGPGRFAVEGREGGGLALCVTGAGLHGDGTQL